MRTIFKYKLYVNDEEQSFDIPGYGGVAFVAYQPDDGVNLVTVWCHVDDDKPMYRAMFRVTGTGQKSPSNDYLYVGSAICHPFVWHVWRNVTTERVVEGRTLPGPVYGPKGAAGNG